MSLLLLFNNFPENVIILNDAGVAPAFPSFENIRPLLYVSPTQAVVDASSVTYNEASVTYSSSLHTYGGSDRIVDAAPSMGRIN